MASIRLSLTSTFAVLLAGCGGGGSDNGGGTSDAIIGLHGPQQVTLVEASGNSTASAHLPHGALGATGTDYATDQTHFWVRDDSMGTLDTVNMILSSLEQTHYFDQTNTGPYRALIEDRSNQGGGERGNDAKAFEEWVVDSTRASNSEPQIVKFWIKSEESMGQDIPSIIYGRLTVTEEPTDAQPLGQFTLYFKNTAVDNGHDSSDTMFQGYLRSVPRTDSLSEVEFFMGHGDPDGIVSSGDFAVRERAHVVGDPAAQTGRAYSEAKSVSNSSVEASEYQLQFNADYVARRDVANGDALSVLDRHDYTTYVYRYGVYDAVTEARIALTGGFPLRDGDGRNGWAGYYGVWFAENAPLTNGQTLYRQTFGTGEPTPYTLFIAPGKLEKRTRSAITLGDLVGEDMETFDPTAGGEQRVRFDGTHFLRVATRQGGEWQVVEPPVNIDSSFTTGQWLNFWSQARGSVQFTWPATLETTTPAFVWQSTTIDGDSSEVASGNLTLNGYTHMLRADITLEQANWQNSESPYLPDAVAVDDGNQTYVFDRERLMLTLGSADVNFASGVSVMGGPAAFGLDCGPLFATALSSLGEFGSQTTTYNWTIGTNNWNQLQRLRDGDGHFVHFDPPRRLTYVHDEPASLFDGRTFFLEWDGANLNGLPWDQDTEHQRWYPRLNIPTGSTAVSGGSSLKIKQLEGEQYFVEVGDPNTVYEAQGFDLDSPLSAPSGTPYQDPAIGALPTVTSAPRYVAGVLQTDG